MQKLLDVMADLRHPTEGCPWDRAQTFASILPYTVEEAYEVADAIDRGDLDDLRLELGDLLLQVVFHARMAEEAGAFDFSGVVDGITEKLRRRHPHVFGAGVGDRPSPDGSERSWEAEKAAERADRGDVGVLDGVSLALPALLRAQKLGRRAAGVGFDWPDVRGSRAKVSEELNELDAACASQDHPAVLEELGDLLFAVVNLARHLEIPAEEALRRANTKFEKRFAHVEASVSAAGGNWSDFSAAELDTLWNAAKDNR